MTESCLQSCLWGDECTKTVVFNQRWHTPHSPTRNMKEGLRAANESLAQGISRVYLLAGKHLSSPFFNWLVYNHLSKFTSCFPWKVFLSFPLSLHLLCKSVIEQSLVCPSNQYNYGVEGGDGQAMSYLDSYTWNLICGQVPRRHFSLGACLLVMASPFPLYCIYDWGGMASLSYGDVWVWTRPSPQEHHICLVAVISSEIATWLNQASDSALWEFTTWKKQLLVAAAAGNCGQ